MKKISRSLLIKHLPVRVRLRLAKLTLWRLKHAQTLTPTLLLICLVVASAGVGYAAAARDHWPTIEAENHPSNQLLAHATVTAVHAAPSKAQDSFLIAELGRLQAEVVHLRVLFLRLADLAQLNDGEFDLDMNFEPALGAGNQQGFLNDTEESYPSAEHRFSSKFAGISPNDSVVLVNQSLVHISEQADRLHSLFRERRQASDFRVSGSPVKVSHVSSRFGYRVNPITGRRQLHRGLDLRGEPGSEILAMADGIVTYSGKNGSYGNLVELEHTDGYRTRYAHNHVVLVPVGQRVSKGQVIATMGSTGSSTGTHVHVEVRHHDRALDPQLYIR